MKFEITVQAETNHGMMEALWKMWEAFRRDETPLGGCCPASMGEPYDYQCRPVPENTDVTVVCDRCKKTSKGVDSPL